MDTNKALQEIEKTYLTENSCVSYWIEEKIKTWGHLISNNLECNSVIMTVCRIIRGYKVFNLCCEGWLIDKSGISLEIVNFLVVSSFLSVMHIKALNRFANKVIVFETERMEHQFWFILIN